MPAKMGIDPKQVEDLVSEGKTITEIATVLGCGTSSVFRAMEKYGIKGVRRSNSPDMVDRDELERLYNQGMTLREIAKQMGFKRPTIGRALTLYDIERTIIWMRSEWCTKDWLYEQYVEQRKSAVEVAQIVDVSPQTILRRLEHFGIEQREMSEISKGYWQNPEYRLRITEAQSQRWQDPEHRDRMSKQRKKLWQNPEYRAKMHDSLMRSWDNPERREYNRIFSKAMWRNPDYRSRAQGQMKDRWQDPEYRSRMLSIHKTRCQDPEYKKRRSVQARAMWENPEHRARMLEISDNFLKYRKEKIERGYRTDIEAIAERGLIRAGIPYIFEYAFGWYSIDFYLPDYQIAIECDGEYWHSSERQKRVDRRRDAYLQSKGITVIRLWGKDIKADIDSLLAWKLLPYLMAQ